jgi:hypothetical protein
MYHASGGTWRLSSNSAFSISPRANRSFEATQNAKSPALEILKQQEFASSFEDGPHFPMFAPNVLVETQGKHLKAWGDWP